MEKVAKCGRLPAKVPRHRARVGEGNRVRFLLEDVAEVRMKRRLQKHHLRRNAIPNQVDQMLRVARGLLRVDPRERNAFANPFASCWKWYAWERACTSLTTWFATGTPITTIPSRFRTVARVVSPS